MCMVSNGKLNVCPLFVMQLVTHLINTTNGLQRYNLYMLDVIQMLNNTFSAAKFRITQLLVQTVAP